MKPIVASLLVLFACTTPVLAEDLFVKDKTDKKLGEPTEDMALVYIIRPSKLGWAIKFWTFADDQILGVTKGKCYTYALVPEGEHLFWAKAEDTSTLEMEVVGGRTYYLKQTARMGFNKARVNLSITNEAEAQETFEKAPYISLTDAGRARGAEIVANRHERAKTKEGKKEKSDEKR